MKEGGPIKADIDNVMMKPFKRSNRRYKVALEENKQKQTGRKKKREERKRKESSVNFSFALFHSFNETNFFDFKYLYQKAVKN